MKDRSTHKLPQPSTQSAHKPKTSQPQTTQSGQIPSRPSMANAAGMLQLQQAAGNRAIQRMFGGAQQTVGAEGGQAPEAVQQGIRQAKGGGQAVDQKVAGQISRSLSTDVSQARVHTDDRSDQINQSLGAEAATIGNDIFFRKGAYNPSSSSGQKLLAHELTHVAQQSGSSGSVQTKLRVGAAHDSHEQQAETVSRSFDNKQAGYKPAQAGTIQRKMNFDENMFVAEASTKSKAVEFMTGSDNTFTKIRKALSAYWQTTDIFEEADYLKVMRGLASYWLSKHTTSKSNDNVARINNLKFMLVAINMELPKVANAKYQARFGAGKGFDSMVEEVYQDPLKEGRKWVRDNKQGKAKPGDDLKYKNQIENYKLFKSYGLTTAERGAIAGYTGEQYRIINPAMRGNRGWLKKNLAGRGLDDSDSAMDEAMIQNKRIGKMVLSGLNKMPNWEQDRVLYRGETMKQAKGDALQVGSIKTYRYFVSTSQDLATPKNQIDSWTTPERPFKVIYHIVRSKTGKNIAPLSRANKAEQEILFKPNTSFEVLAIKNEKLDFKEVSLREV